MATYGRDSLENQLATIGEEVTSKMNRRNLFKLICSALVFPLTVYKSKSATKFMQESCLAHTKSVGHIPKVGFASKGLFDKYESELVRLQRFVPTETHHEYSGLVFKSTRLYRSNQDGWWIEWF